jgi:hypothetical protein
MKRFVCSAVFGLLASLTFAQNAALPRLAVVEFSTNSTVQKTKEDAITVRNLVESQMIATGKYQIITRDEIDKLLKNQSIAVSSISSTENIKKLQLQNINYIVTGSLDAMDSDYAITVKVLDVATGQFSHSANDFMGNSSRDLYNGIGGLMTKFINGMTSSGGQVMNADALKAEAALKAAASAGDTGIRVTVVRGGSLYFQGEEVATLFDNDSHLVPITKPGVYTLRMRFGDGYEATRAVTITGRGIVDIRFGDPPAPPQGLRTGTVVDDSIALSWNNAGVGVTYKVYYGVENNPDRAKISGSTISYTSTTVRNLEGNKTYYFWISSVEAGIEGVKSDVVSEKIPYHIGTRGPAGGLVFYDKGQYSDGWRYLEAAPQDLANAQWGAYGNRVSGTNDEIGSGKRNTQVIVDYLKRTGESGRAAQLCASYTYGGMSDWFLPSKDELNLMYTNLKAKGLGNFQNDWYRSSSENDYYSAWGQAFSDGGQFGAYKNITNCVRAVRAF